MPEKITPKYYFQAIEYLNGIRMRHTIEEKSGFYYIYLIGDESNKITKKSLFGLLKPGTDAHKIDLFVQDDDTIYTDTAAGEFVGWLNANLK
ncbi:hypothetical protein EFM34_05975 [Leuconostoc suionicum]|uniref:hypothetical protein n=1 Tax=Leuconostoc suionicum TaxID=1511761 RepID=UPI0021AA4B75|nr:hypothetical protein [Leuconostoc suionicum]MCT4382778.1 hypothetical protein [Leuconostoc suionicum]